MWMLLSDYLLGNLEAGTFLELRLGEDGDDLLELIHVDLRSTDPADVTLLRADEQTCDEAFGLIADYLEADDLLLRVLMGEQVDEELGSFEPAWLDLDESTLFNVDTGAVLTVSEAGEDLFGVVYATRAGSLALHAGTRDEADAYLNALGTVLGSSDALLAAGGADLAEGLAGRAGLGLKRGRA